MPSFSLDGAISSRHLCSPTGSLPRGAVQERHLRRQPRCGGVWLSKLCHRRWISRPLHRQWISRLCWEAIVEVRCTLRRWSPPPQHSSAPPCSSPATTSNVPASTTPANWLWAPKGEVWKWGGELRGEGFPASPSRIALESVISVLSRSGAAPTPFGTTPAKIAPGAALGALPKGP
jgi:hypothetical protein